ncbi:MAG: asparagine synthetase B family protein [Candidatus Acidiferrales bacterium]
MSGIAGMVQTDGRPVDGDLIRRMTNWLSFRGPDAQGIWTHGPVGLGHALLSHTGEAERERQPATLDQRNWIVADVRLDARSELVNALRSNGRDARLSNPDAQLLLHAYEVWGEACLEHLLGDFAFAIWNGQLQRLFCACDHFGIKALYFAEVERSLVFSNTLDCVRLHPAVSDRLNDVAIADFLLFGMNYDQASTSFADIRRLPRAHSLRWSAAGLQIHEYWRPPTNGAIHYSKRRDYIERFRELFTSAVDDRLRAKSVGILLSGGLDSSSVTAVAHDLRKEKYPVIELHAFTSTYQKLPADRDTPAARTVATALQIPLHCWPVDSGRLFEHWDDPQLHWPEPNDDPFAASFRGEFKSIAGNVRVLLSGEGSDNLMGFEMAQHLRCLWRDGRAGRAFLDVAEHVWRRFQAPDGLRGLLRRLGRLFSPRRKEPAFPAWIQPELVARLNLEKRWKDALCDLPWNAHPRRPKSYGSLFLPQWDFMFRQGDAGVTGQPLEVRYPFLDLRLVNYLLAIPMMPWSFRKYLLREAMRGRLPEGIRTRPKTPFRGDPLLAELQRGGADAIAKMQPSARLNHYITESWLPSLTEKMSAEESWLRIRPICLNFWLLSLSTIERSGKLDSQIAPGEEI